MLSDFHEAQLITIEKGPIMSQPNHTQDIIRLGQQTAKMARQVARRETSRGHSTLLFWPSFSDFLKSVTSLTAQPEAPACIRSQTGLPTTIQIAAGSPSGDFIMPQSLAGGVRGSRRLRLGGKRSWRKPGLSTLTSSVWRMTKCCVPAAGNSRLGREAASIGGAA